MHLHDRISRLLKNVGPESTCSSLKSDRIPDKSIISENSHLVSAPQGILNETARKNIQLSVANATADHRHSATLLMYRSQDGQVVPLGLRDLLVISAIANTHVLVRGSSGCGKTLIANGIMRALFGNNYVEQHITPGTSSEDFVGLDFGMMRQGHTLEEAITASRILCSPGAILNEINRTPEVLQNILIPFLDRKFSHKTKEFKTGLTWLDARYQYVIGTMNEGPEYGGTCGLDRAVRERFGMEISLDQFPIRPRDRIRQESFSQPGKSCQAEVLSLAGSAMNISLTEEATALISYISGLDHCLKSNTGTKRGISFNTALCEGCHHAQPMKNVCGNIFAPSQRALDSWMRITQSMVIWAGVSDRVYAQDLISIGPFVFEGKSVISTQWISQQWQGNTYKAIENVLAEVYARFCNMYKTSEGKSYLLGQPITAHERKCLSNHAERDDPWALNKKNS